MEATEQVIDKWLPQLRKGLLEILILEIVAAQISYGYEIASRLKSALRAEIAEGTLYPLLKRLLRDELVTTQWVTDGQSAPRKYYRITPLGESVLLRMRQEWTTADNALKELSQ